MSQNPLKENKLIEFLHCADSEKVRALFFDSNTRVSKETKALWLAALLIIMMVASPTAGITLTNS